MRKHFPVMQERPEVPRIFIGLIYGILAFFSLPFIMLILLQGSFEDDAVVSGIEIAYHVINGAAALYIMWEYIKDCFLYAAVGWRDVWKTVGIGAGIMLLVANLEACLLGLESNAIWASYGIVPLTEVELFLMPSFVVQLNPVLGTICMSVAVPFAISALFYAVVFAPICCKKPWLAYLVMAVYLFFPRFCNGFTYWDMGTEIMMYFVQLPLHMIACWTYQKTDTIWAPILTHGIVNFLTSLYWIIPMLLMGLA